MLAQVLCESLGIDFESLSPQERDRYRAAADAVVRCDAQMREAEALAEAMPYLVLDETYFGGIE